MSNSLQLRVAKRADLPLIEKQLYAQYKDTNYGLAYPRCETITELLAEFGLYSLDWKRGLRIIESAQGMPLAAFGLLFSPEDLGTGTMIERNNHSMVYRIGPYILS